MIRRRQAAVVVAAGVAALALAGCAAGDATGVAPTASAGASDPGTTIVVTTGATDAPTTAATTAPAPALVPPVALQCGDRPEETGAIADPLDETSGIAPSRANPGTWWVHNDSGDAPRAFRVDDTGAVVEERRINGAQAVDWEDIAAAPDGTIWIADTGDNFRFRTTVRLYGFPDAAPGDAVVEKVSYPEGPTDVEALAIDPVTGEKWLFSKGDTSVAYLVPPGGGTATAVATLPLATVTAADFAPDGVTLAVKTYQETSLWRRASVDEPWAQVLQRPADCTVEAGEGEAVAFTPDAAALVTVAEGKGSPLLRTPIA